MKRLKMTILTYLVKNLFVGLTIDDVFSIRAGYLYIANEKVSEEVAKEYKNQANDIQNLEVWKMVQKQTTFMANQRMFEKAKTTDDLFFGKACLYNLSLVSEYLSSLAKIKL